MFLCKNRINKTILALCMITVFTALTGCEGEEGDAQALEQAAESPVIVVEHLEDDNSVILPEVTDVPAEPEPEEEPPVEEDIYDPVGKVYSMHAASDAETTLAFVGDIGFAEGYATINVCRAQPNGIFDCIQPGVMEIMQGVDIMMANNEFPYSDRGSPTPNKTYTFRARPETVSLMTDMGVDIVSLANNHAYDYGPDALMDTFDILEGARLPYVGAGRNIAEARKPVYYHINGHVVSYVSATQIERYANPDTKEATETEPGVLRTLDPTMACEVIREAAANSDFVVMYVHWGSESTDLVEDSQRNLAKAYVEAGADLIIGDHSHCLQGIDYIEDVPVFYSLGNYWFNSKTLDTCIVKVTLNEEFDIGDVEFIPCIQKGSKVYLGDGDNYDRILGYMRGISNYAEISDRGIVTKSDTNHNTQNGQNTSPAKKVETPAEPEVPEVDPAAMQALIDMMNAQAAGGVIPEAGDGSQVPTQ